MIWRAMRLPKRLKLSALVALAVPALIAFTAISTLAASSPSPSPSGSGALPGDPAKGATLYAQNCATCHGTSLEGGIGAVLNPLDKLTGVPNPLDSNSLIDIIPSGRTPQTGDPKQIPMPAKGG